MPLLIDGYNLLHATGIFGQGTGPGGFERSRRALLEFLAQSLRLRERRSTTVVFDASQAPPGLPSQLSHEGITIYFSRHHTEADDLIEELIEAAKNPKRLTVVSSDHRLQRAARRRGAAAIDSHIWYHDLRQEVAAQAAAGERTLDKPEPNLSRAQVELWLREFGEEPSEKKEQAAPKQSIDDADEKADAERRTTLRQQETPPTPKPKAGLKKKPEPRRRRRTAKPSKKPPHLPGREIGNPFPPGYGSDVEE